MTGSEITQFRLHNQLIAGSTVGSPVEVVRWLGAVQSQDYLAAKWAVGLRTRSASDVDLEQAYNEGELLRTHVLRPTWHFVTPADIRWMLTLTAPRIKAASAYYYHRLGLERPVLSRSNSIVEKALEGGKQMTRAELEVLFTETGLVSTGDDPLRFINLVINAEIDGIVCSGMMRGKQHTYALLEERAPKAPAMSREESLAELAGRYFTSRGPATLKDYTWWSGLTRADAKAGLEMVKQMLVEEMIDGQSYWLHPSLQIFKPEITPALHLLPNYDEYVVSYANRSAIYDPGKVKQVDERGNFLFNHTIVIDGQVIGTWKREFRKGGVEITPNLFTPISDAENQTLTLEMRRYSRFLGMPQLIAYNSK
jgi:hypothetical protein